MNSLFRVTVIFVIGSLLNASAHAEEIPGEIVRVNEKTITIASDSEFLPAEGDPVAVYIEIEGVGKASVASARVTKVDSNGAVTAEFTEASARVVAGQLVAITSANPSKRRLPKAPIATARPASKELLFLGLLMHHFEFEDDGAQVFVDAIWPDSPAERAGFRAGDRILRFQGQLALLYEAGLGVPKDTALSEKWLRQAFDRGLPYAGRQLGYLYATMNRPEATDVYYKAAEMGSVRAYADIGYLCLTGTFVKKGPALGGQWIQRAIDQGSGYAAFTLGLVCFEGKGVPVDRQKGIKYLRMATRLKHPDKRAADYLRQKRIEP